MPDSTWPQVSPLGRHRAPRPQALEHPPQPGLHAAHCGPGPRPRPLRRGGGAHGLRRHTLVPRPGAHADAHGLLRGRRPLVGRLHPRGDPGPEAALPRRESLGHAAAHRWLARVPPRPRPRLAAAERPRARGGPEARGVAATPREALQAAGGARGRRLGAVPGLPAEVAHFQSDAEDLGRRGHSASVPRAPQRPPGRGERPRALRLGL
mmetsp:Transcript_108874/g.339289  ORF Transcript_108874/g.339289 Transcript_108874/m.339289 type:complete len:208 (+) Transcript_108874:499-1122(+)